MLAFDIILGGISWLSMGVWGHLTAHIGGWLLARAAP